MWTEREETTMETIEERAWDFLKQKKRHFMAWMFLCIEGGILYSCVQTGILELFAVGIIATFVTLLYVENQF